MHPEITLALMNERVRETRAYATDSRDRRIRRPRLLPRNPRPRAAWTNRTTRTA